MLKIPSINISEYDYPLPDEKIAKYPLPERDRSKLLVCRNGHISDSHFYNLPGLLNPGSLLVLNNTRVIHARLNFRRETGAAIEIFCLEPDSPVKDIQLAMQQAGTCVWKCLVGNAKKWKGEKLFLKAKSGQSEYVLSAEITERHNESFFIRFEWNPGQLIFSQIIDTAGNVPLPPYIHRPAEQSDNERYQTVYASDDGSVAAPTAGLHFTPEVFEKILQKEISTSHTTLHVGAGTFKPVQSENIEQHVMHSEQVVIHKQLLEDLLAAKGDIIAVGTTSVRSLESLYYVAVKLHSSGVIPDKILQWEPYETELHALNRNSLLHGLTRYMEDHHREEIAFSTNIIIVPGYQFKMIDGMVTNFHQPRSTLLLLVSAFFGDKWKLAYEHALSGKYRFLSYGDACLFMK
ncbi:MAG TPA: S-adenosylmethionine:tRNA ribosyltransferase-isomerase [Bacteroidales bacterium]|nr:S-adenosylmethionine:tRNA ribosyltransferase-isomerase [Bacteroidales bacterium]